MNNNIISILTQENFNLGKEQPLYYDKKDKTTKKADSENEIKGKDVDTKISLIATKINSALKESEVDTKKLNILQINIDKINQKIEKHNNKVKGFYYKILRNFLKIFPFSSNLKEQVSFADKISSPTLQKHKKLALNSYLKNYSPLMSMNDCSDQEKSKILETTDFVEHEKWKGRIESVNITKDMIQQMDLTPAIKTTILSEEIYLSKVFEADQIPDSDPPAHQLAAIAYMKENGGFIPRILYLSGVDNLWRAAPIKDGLRNGKGLEVVREKPVKASTNVPFDLGMVLFSMSRDEKTLIKNKESNKKTLSDIYNMIPDNTRNYDPNELETKNATKDFIESHKLESIDLIHTIDSENQPNFMRVDKYTIPGTFSEEVTVYRMPSLNDTYEFVFYEAKCHGEKNPETGDYMWTEKESRPWLASVSKKDTPISSYCTYKTCLNPNGADNSGSEYFQYIRKDLLSNEESNRLKKIIPKLEDPSIVPTWEIRKNFNIIQLFEEWKLSAGQ